MKTFKQLKNIKRVTSFITLLLLIGLVFSGIMYIKYPEETMLVIIIQLILLAIVIVLKLVLASNTYKVMCREITNIVEEYAGDKKYICCIISETNGYVPVEVEVGGKFDEEKYYKCREHIESYLSELELELKKSFVLLINTREGIYD